MSEKGQTGVSEEEEEEGGGARLGEEAGGPSYLKLEFWLQGE